VHKTRGNVIARAIYIVRWSSLFSR